jgi:hypothetical protein
MIHTKKADHQVIIELRKVSGKRMSAVPSIPRRMAVGETVSYSSPAGSFRVDFPDGLLFNSQPGPAVITDSTVHTLINSGKFECRCFVIPAEGAPVGWSPENPESGGVHDVVK